MARTKFAAAAAAATLIALLAGCTSAPPSSPSGNSTEPIRIGGTLALSGPLAPTGAIHKVAGEQFVEWLNENGGLLGRQVEWVLLDDESNPQTSAAAYTRLISQENVDLLIGPYGTANITAAMDIAERNEMVFPHHSATLTYAYDYKWHFPLFASGRNSSSTMPTTIFDAYEELGSDAPKTVAFVVNENPASGFIAKGHEEEKGAIDIAKDRGLDVVLELDFPQGNTDWAPIAQRIKDADPDLLWVGALGGDSPALLTALSQVGWEPRHQFHLFPAPGLLLSAGDLVEGATTMTMFEPHEPFMSNTGADIMVDRYVSAAKDAGLAYTAPEIQAALSWASWQTIVAGVEGCECLDQKGIGEYLLGNEIETVLGGIDFDPTQNNYYGDLAYLKQVQDGEFYVVYPSKVATDGRAIR
ncbi:MULTISPECIES: amino acid ABC transporter substrate-binding protein [unclassified Diaminobutyricimonas]|uniref:amino acid ABC transporter substrate-binding protein n=1 Tax=unclassified Diaminobutyricimonas TaxID=2643261 RepID=UPI0012F49E79|nr:MULTISPECIES: amino acid ABC transporter substrate-binding protein [unclassified Diaminobutyricimonas]